MRNTTLASLAFFPLALSVVAYSAPPEGKGGGKGGGGKDDDPPADFVPEILYKSDGQKSEDIIFANRAGDQAVLIYRGSKSVGSAFAASSNSDVSPQPNMITWSDGETAYITSWTETNGFSLGSPSPIHSFPGGRMDGLTISNGDDAIAMSNGGRGLYIYNIPAGDIAGGSVTPYIEEDFVVYKARWSPDDKSLYFFGGSDAAAGGTDGLYRFDLDNRVLTKIFNRQPGHRIYVDVAQTTNGTTLIATSLDGSLQLYDDSGNPITLTNAPVGDNFVFNCDATQVLHRVPGTRKTRLAISQLSGGTTTWAEGRVQPIADWMPRQPC